MTRIPVDHGRIRVHLPGDWQDRSALLFVAPSHEAFSAPLSGRQAEMKHRTLSVVLDPTTSASPMEYVRSLGADALRSIVIAAREGACGERRLPIAEGWVRQLIAAVFVAEGLALLAIGSADEGSFETYRTELESLIAAIEVR